MRCFESFVSSSTSNSKSIKSDDSIWKLLGCGVGSGAISEAVNSRGATKG